MNQEINAAYVRAVNKLGKWRSVLVGWMVGTRSKDAPGVQALRDAAEARLILRSEVNALTALLIEKGVFTVDEFKKQVALECEEYCQALERVFPGYRATDEGIAIQPELAKQTNERLGFPL